MNQKKGRESKIFWAERDGIDPVGDVKVPNIAINAAAAGRSARA